MKATCSTSSASGLAPADHRPRDRAMLAIHHATLELRVGRDVVIRDGSTRLRFAALDMLGDGADNVEHRGAPDTADTAMAERLGEALELLIGPERAGVLGHEANARAVRLQASLGEGAERTTQLDAIRQVAGLVDPALAADVDAVGRLSDCRGDAAAAAIELARQSRLQPVLLLRSDTTSPVTGRDADAPLELDAADVLAYPRWRGALLARTGSAPVQLATVPTAAFVAYRERFGDAEHVAVIVGSPDFTTPVPVRLHSACFTGDLFGSLRCDCGEQLSGAVEQLRAAGGGVVLYLAQEGRGIGLGNKLRAYQLQAMGFDTIEADRRLGFGADGRDFTAARHMLKDLGIARVRLLTNNPAKVAALDGDGLAVVERLPLSGSINAHNERYLETKRDRAGHLPSILDGHRPTVDGTVGTDA